MTSANAGDGKNQLHRFGLTVKLTRKSVKDCRVVQVLLAVFWSSREPRISYTNQEMTLMV